MFILKHSNTLLLSAALFFSALSSTPAVAADAAISLYTPVAVTDSANNTWGAQRAIDNDLSPDSRWSTSGDGHWLKLDLGEPVSINGIALAFYKGNERIVTFSVETSLDGQNWTLQMDHSKSAGGTTDFERFTFPTTTANYLRVTGHGNSVNDWNSIVEVKGIYNPVFNTANNDFVTYKPVAGSNSGNDGVHVPERSFDENYGDDSRWSANGQGQWLTLDFGATEKMNGVAIAFFRGDARTATVSVDTSIDGKNWTPQLNKITSSGTTADYEPFNFASTDARYVRITGYGNSTSNWNSILEARAFYAAEKQTGVQYSVNILTPTSASASGNDGHTADRTIDDNLEPESRWSSYGDGQWLTLALDKSRPVNGVAIAFYKGDQRQAEFSVATSLDGNTWTPQLSHAVSSGKTADYESFDFVTTQAAYIRITGHGNTYSDWNSILEARGVYTTVNQSAENSAFDIYTPVIVSDSGNDGHTADRTIDGSLEPESRWSSFGKGQWLTLGLGNVKKVSGVAIAFYKGDARTAEFSVATSLDGKNWSLKLDRVKSAGNTKDFEQFSFADTDAAFVRITGYGNSNSDWNSIVEVRAFRETNNTQEPVPTYNTYKPASTSDSGNDGHTSDLTIDGSLDPASRWSSYGDGQWLTLALNGKQTVNGIAIAFYKGDQRVAEFSVETSLDGVTWTQQLVRVSSSGSTSDFEQFTFATTDAAFIRITGHGNSTSDWTSILETNAFYDSTVNVAPLPDQNVVQKSAVPTSYRVQLSWVAPTKRIDGSPITLSEIDHYEIYYFPLNSTSIGGQVVTVAGHNTSTEINIGSTGQYVFAIACIDSDGLISDISPEVTLTVE